MSFSLIPLCTGTLACIPSSTIILSFSQYSGPLHSSLGYGVMLSSPSPEQMPKLWKQGSVGHLPTDNEADICLSSELDPLVNLITSNSP